jgi:hypothetical protein
MPASQRRTSAAIDGSERKETGSCYMMYWVGIDAGREGLWREPTWSGVLHIIARHQGSNVYDENAPIYADLENRYPNEAWRSRTAQGQFRPLFRDYPNSWTRTGVLSLDGQKFKLTALGMQVIAGEIGQSVVLVRMFKMHTEVLSDGTIEKPFGILANAFLESPRPLETAEVYWSVMLAYRPRRDDLNQLLKRPAARVRAEPEPTPYRRLRNMLSLLRAAGAIQSTRRRIGTYWSVLDRQILDEIARAGTK